MHQLLRTQFVPRSAEEMWDFFSTPKNLDQMTPDFLKFEIVKGADEPMFEGQLIEYRIEILPGVKTTWLTEITHCVQNSYFIDEQRIGPYRLWHHLHRFEEVNGGIQMLDRVDYLLPMGPIGKMVQKLFVAKRLKTVFDHRDTFLQKRFGASPAASA